MKVINLISILLYESWMLHFIDWTVDGTLLWLHEYTVKLPSALATLALAWCVAFIGRFTMHPHTCVARLHRQNEVADAKQRCGCSLPLVQKSLNKSVAKDPLINPFCFNVALKQRIMHIYLFFLALILKTVILIIISWFIFTKAMSEYVKTLF